MMLLAYAVPLAKSGEAAKAGPIGLAVIVLLCIACYFLFKSMSKHLRRVRENFPEQPTGQHPEPPAETAEAAPPPASGEHRGEDQPPAER
jgi:hypothetical protein